MTKDKILVANGYNYANAIKGLGNITFNISEFMKNPESFQLILFTGGEDVSPELYGDVSPKRLCHNNWDRDMVELEIFNLAFKHSIKMTGICRGIQFLNVMSGGKMMHHINNHAIGKLHEFKNKKNGEIIQVNSLHHQMVIPGENGIVIGWANEKLATIYIGNNDEEVQWDFPEVEAVLYPSTLCCGVQYHPEMMKNTSDGYIFYHTMIKDFLNMTIEKFTEVYTENERTHSAYR